MPNVPHNWASHKGKGYFQTWLWFVPRVFYKIEVVIGKFKQVIDYNSRLKEVLMCSTWLILAYKDNSMQSIEDYLQDLVVWITIILKIYVLFSCEFYFLFRNIESFNYSNFLDYIMTCCAQIYSTNFISCQHVPKCVKITMMYKRLYKC